MERGGKPLVILLSPGQRQERPLLDALLDDPQGVIRQPGRRGRARHRPAALGGDKGYTSRAIRARLHRQHIHAVIPRLAHEPRRGVRFDQPLYRERNVVERTINRLKRFRRVATRYEKRADHFHAMLILAAILMWL